MFAAVSITVKEGKRPTCPSTDEWVNKMWYIHTMKYVAIKLNKILTRATMWVTHEEHYAK